MTMAVADLIGRLRGEALLQFITQYVSPRALLRDDYSIGSGAAELVYKAEDQFWQDARHEQLLYESRRVILRDFVILQWIPLTPGQYHTPEARALRQKANGFILERSSQRGVIYDPHGKANMVRGGRGCLRLMPKEVTGESLHFLCATSSGAADRGVLLAAPKATYQTIVEPLHDKGAIFCDVVGEIRYFPSVDALPIDVGQSMPRVYVYVEEFKPREESPLRTALVEATAVITFEGTFQGSFGRFFTYSSFNPTNPEDVRRCANWMEQEYVKARYQGRVFTDFDETVRHFEGVRLPVTTVMNPNVNQKALVHHFEDAFGLNTQQTKYIINVFDSSIGFIGDDAEVDQRFEG